MAKWVGELSKEELNFELLYRSHPVDYKGTTAAKMRDILLGLLEKEKDGPLEDGVTATVEEELAIAELKLQTAELSLSMVTGGEGDARASKLRAGLSHLNRRISRLLPMAVGEERERVKDALVQLKDLVAKFRDLGEGSVFNATVVMSVSAKKERSEKDDKKNKEKKKNKKSKAKAKVKVESESSSEENTDKTDSSSEEETKKTPKFARSLDVHKWGLKFNGLGEGTSVLSFIADVEEKASWKGIDVNHLVAGASEFFEGQAKTWFRGIRSKIDSWSELKIALRKQYLPLNYYETLWEEIRSRKQGSNELMGTYVANMIGMFGWLELGEKVSDETKLAIIQRNLAPFYLEKLALTPVRSLEELKTLGKQLEFSKQRVEGYDAGKSKSKPIAPEFAYKQPTVRKPVVNEVNPVKKMICWKCRGEGHSFSTCTKEQKGTFCYKCGKQEVTTKTCPKCSKPSPKGKPEQKSGE
ncbi:uncharacterized protein LOC117649074 [Thrips palmi]|uniref:Uncharacterized protein LOC117649074 n=1 Tax=Thrips palmi TaxID=161013 RepID=A0A6P8ZRC7_THRPL|nr:uncharacterized protein LOC117649074 [Thrips palmi]